MSKDRKDLPASDAAGSIRLLHRTDPGTGSQFRLIDDAQREIEWANRFLDQLHARGLSPASLRGYGCALLHFLRWWMRQPSGADAHCLPPSQDHEKLLMEFLQDQASRQPRPSPQSLLLRFSTAQRLLNMLCPAADHTFQQQGRTYYQRIGLGYGRARMAVSRMPIRVPRRVVVPLSDEEVASFWRSFRTSRDLAMVGMMLLSGLRSGEVLALELDDVLREQAQLRVKGKGNRPRVVPLAPETIALLDHYLRLERPQGCKTRRLFVSMKGPARGQPLTLAGLRSLFRHHRKTTGVSKANPHRFRHTFASDMIRAGVSLPALMRLMGHSQIHTTLIYVQLTPRDVYNEYAKAVTRLTRPKNQS